MSNIFKTFQNCISGKDSSESEIKEIPPYVFCKYLGSNYKTIQKTLNGRVNFIKFIKTENLKISADEELLMKHYKINKKVASEYLKEIDKSELNRLRLLYKKER